MSYIVPTSFILCYYGQECSYYALNIYLSRMRATCSLSAYLVKLCAILCSRATLYYPKVIYKQVFHQKFNHRHIFLDRIEFSGSIMRASTRYDVGSPIFNPVSRSTVSDSKEYCIRIGHNFNNLQGKN